MRFKFISSIAFACALSAPAAFACTSAEMAKTEAGFVLKIIAGSDRIAAYADATGTVEEYRLELMRPYFVICEEGDFYRITDAQALTVAEAEAGNTGYVRADQVFIWNTREALNFSDVAFMAERNEIVAWDDERVLAQYLETLNIKAHPPAFRENLTATLARARETRPYPVLGSDVRRVGKTGEKRVFNALIPAALTPDDRLVVTGAEGAGNADETAETVRRALTSATILLVFDATGSMDTFALETAEAIGAALKGLDAQVVENSRMGILFYRDAEDEERLVEIPPLPLNEAAEALRKAASLMSGGGDAAEPVLDAIYYGLNFYKWSGEQGVPGAQIVVAVLNDDAHPRTIGSLDRAGRVPQGLDVAGVARAALEKSIPVITVQAGPKEGPNLVHVLETMANNVPGGAFIRWNAGLKEKEIADALIRATNAEVAVKVEKGRETIGRMAFDLNGFPTIPLEVMDGELIERLRTAGIDFNIEMGSGGVLVRKAYLLENNDLLAPTIQIEKETLQNLINLYALLGTVSPDGESMREAVSQALAAIAGEEFDPSETIQSVVQKRLGIQFRSVLLDFDLAYLDALTPAERLSFAKRLQEAATGLNYYLEANLAEFDRLPSVWMPVSALP